MDNSFRATSTLKGEKENAHYAFTVGVNSRSGLHQDFSDMVNDYSGAVKTTDGLMEDLRSFVSFSGNYNHFKLNVNLSQADKEMFLDGEPENVIGTKDGSIAHLLGGNGQIGYTDIFLDSLLIKLERV